MSNIQDLLNNKRHQYLNGHNLIKSIDANSRNFYESCALLVAINSQLNLPKNKIKPPLNTIEPLESLTFLKLEMWELRNELVKKKQDKIRILEEIGDCGAFLVAIIDRVLSNE
jgi:hypothetical protein